MIRSELNSCSSINHIVQRENVIDTSQQPFKHLIAVTYGSDHYILWTTFKYASTWIYFSMRTKVITVGWSVCKACFDTWHTFHSHTFDLILFLRARVLIDPHLDMTIALVGRYSYLYSLSPPLYGVRYSNELRNLPMLISPTVCLSKCKSPLPNDHMHQFHA